jgi:DNA-binding CsgD family transcriptional regulator
MSEKLDQSNYDKILQKLNIIIQLLAHQLVTQHETLETRAIALRSSGLMPAEIAKICGTTPNAVRVSLTQGKKQGKVKRVRKA